MTRIDRRFLLGAGAAALAAAHARFAFAQGVGDKKLVVIILRGAMDGLSACAPREDGAYRGARGRLALTRGLALSDGFSLHPAFAFLHESWRAGELALLHACATPARTRSHFDAQDVLESGGAAVFAVSDGWLNRALAATPGGEGVALASTLPLILRGSAPASSWSPSFAPAAQDDTLARLADLYARDALLGPALAQASATNAIAAGMDGANRRGARVGPASYAPMAEAAARLINAPEGPNAAVLSFDGWDTHANQGAEQGQLAARFEGLDAALRALKSGLGAHWRNSVVLVVTEFGRTVAANGTGGTDHGAGALAMALGGAVRGGRMLGAWPGLARGALYEGRDLAPVNDVRALFASVLSQHWALDGATLRTRVFPDARGLVDFDSLIRAA